MAIPTRTSLCVYRVGPLWISSIEGRFCTDLSDVNNLNGFFFKVKNLPHVNLFGISGGAERNPHHLDFFGSHTKTPSLMPYRALGRQ